jgi:hypothetical protein
MSTPGTQTLTAGWYPDPAGGQGLRWWDGQGWTGQTSFALPLQPLGASFASLGDWLARLLLVNAGLSVLSMVVELWGAAEMGTFLNDPENGDLGALDTYDIVSRFVALGALALLVFTGIVWLIWQRRLARSAPAKLRHTAGLHVGAWFIPIANLWLPVQNMRDLWRAYEPRRPQAGPAPSSMIGAWWGLFLASSVLGRLTFSAYTGTESLENYRMAADLSAVAALVTAGAAVLAWIVVHRLSWRALKFFSDAG